jgi:hypothetical protein
MNELAIVDSGPSTPRLYERMQIAIAECQSVDDCKTIADHAVAIAAYHKQIKDDETVRKFFQIKLRAWRRIGELLTATVDRTGCGDNLAAYMRRIRAAFRGNEAVHNLTEGSMREAIRIASLPADFFERNVSEYRNISSIVFAYERLQREQWLRTPEGKKELKLRAEELKRWEENKAQKEKKAAENAVEDEDRQRTLLALQAAHQEAINEVGITLERHDRERMREVVFLIKDAIHEALRQAAFDQRTTMQAVLRAGLAMWFVAYGYDVPLSEMDLRPKPKQHP